MSDPHVRPSCNTLYNMYSIGLNQYFAEKVAAMTRRHGLSLLASEDLFFDDKNQPFNLKSFNNDIKVIARRNIWEQKKAHLAYRLANHDYKVCVHKYEPYYIYESVHEISNNVLCPTSKASDQPAHTHSLIRAFASRLSIL